MTNTPETQLNSWNERILGYLTSFEHLPYGIAVVKNDACATLLEANPAYYKMIGYTKEQLLEQNENRLEDLLIDDLSHHGKHHSQSEDFDVEFDLRIRTADESVRWMHGYTHFDAKLDVFFLTIADISDKLVATARPLSYETLQVRNKILGHFNIYTTEHVTVTDAITGEVMYLNLSASKVFGLLQEKDWLGKSYWDIAFGGVENTPSFYEEPIGEDQFTEGEYYNELHKCHVHIKSKIITVENLNRKMRLNIVTDITAKKQLESRVALRNALYSCIETLFTTTATNNMRESVFYDVLKQLQEYYGADGAFFYKFVNGTNQLEKIYRILGGEIQPNHIPFPISVSDAQVQLLQNVSALSVEESRSASQMYGDIIQESFTQFNVDYEVQQFSSIAVNNELGQLLAFMGVVNPHQNVETKELLQLLSRFVCMFLEHQQDQKIKEDAIKLEEISKANILNKCATNFRKSSYAKENITDILGTLCEHYDADFAMVVHGNKDDDTYGVPYIGGDAIPDLSTMQNQPRYTMDKWAETFKKHAQFVTDTQVDAPTAKRILKNQFGVYNFIVAPLRDGDGTLTGLIFVCNYKLMNRSHLAVHMVAKTIANYLTKVNYDDTVQLESTTRIENKAIAQNQVSAMLENEESSTLFVLNIDNFRQLNDTLGHHVGDQVLLDLSDSLHRIFRHTDVISRIGGDEFMVFAPSLILADLIAEKANQILNKCHHLYNKDGSSVEISASIGICRVNEHCKTFQPLYENADYALYVAKKSGKNRYHIYSDVEYANDSSVVDELRFYPNVVEKLKYAIENHRFVVHYQPLYHVPSGTFTQAEALVRMEKSDGTLIYPNDFIQVAESSGLVVEMTYQILEQVCSDFRKLLNEHPDTPLKAIAINVPYLQFVDPNMEDQFLKILKKYDIMPGQIKLEITERSIIADMDLMMGKIDSLKEKGFEFELDDFGTDYSNLQMCISLPLAVTKLDRSLLLAALATEEGRQFFEHIVAGVHATGRQTVMEGVETQEQLEWATKLNCEHIQGYYFSKPVDFANFSGFLRKIK